MEKNRKKIGKLLIIAASVMILLSTFSVMIYNAAVNEISVTHALMVSTVSTLESKFSRMNGLTELSDNIIDQTTDSILYIVDEIYDNAENVQDVLDILKSDSTDLYFAANDGTQYACRGAAPLTLTGEQIEQLRQGEDIHIEDDGKEVEYTGRTYPEGLLIIHEKSDLSLGENSTMTGLSDRFHWFVADLDSKEITMTSDEDLLGRQIPKRWDKSLLGIEKKIRNKVGEYRYGFSGSEVGNIYYVSGQSDGRIYGLYVDLAQIFKNIFNEVLTPIVLVSGMFVILLLLFFHLKKETEGRKDRISRALKTGKICNITLLRSILGYLFLVFVAAFLSYNHYSGLSAYAFQNSLAIQNLDVLSGNIEACEKDRKIEEKLVKNYLSAMADKISSLFMLNDSLCTHEKLKEIAARSSFEEITLYNADAVAEASSGPYSGYRLTECEDDVMYAAHRILDSDADMIYRQFQDGTGRYFVAARRKDAPGILCMIYRNEQMNKVEKYYSAEDAIRRTDFGNATTFFVNLEAQEDITYVIDPYSDEIRSLNLTVPEELRQDSYSGIADLNGKKSYINTKTSEKISVISAVDCLLIETMMFSNTWILFVAFFLLFIVFFCACISRNTEEKAHNTDLQNDTKEASAKEEIIKPSFIAASLKDSWAIVADSCFRKTMKRIGFVVAAAYIVMLFKKTDSGMSMLKFLFLGRWDKGVNLFSINVSVIVIVLTLLVLYLMRKILEFMAKIVGPKAVTIGNILMSIFRFGGFFFAILHTLYQFGVDTTALIAGAGITGMVIGIAAKDILGDLIAGIFLIFEGNIKVGDYIQLKDFCGEVHEIGARVSVIRKDNKKLIVNNSDLKHYYRLNDELAYVPIEITISGSEDIEEVKNLLEESKDWYRNRDNMLLDGPFFNGVSRLSGDSMTISIYGRCAQKDQEKCIRKLLLHTMELFREKGIKLK